MLTFLSEENLAIHKEQLRLSELRYSIIVDGIPMLKNINIKDIPRQKMTKRDKNDALRLLGDVLAHRAYFSSFAAEGGRDHPLVGRSFGSRASLLNRMLELALANPPGFVALSCSHGRLMTDYAPNGAELYLSADPILVIDTWEHAYFSDYGFNRERYFTHALSHLNFDKLHEIENIG